MRKRIVILLTIVLAIVTNTNAQQHILKKVKFGIRAGANLTTLGMLRVEIPNLANEQFDYNYKLGFTAGIFSEIPLSRKFMLLPEINYSQKGGDIDVNVDNTFNYPYRVTSKSRVNYIDVPFAVAYKVIPKFIIFAGPQISLFLNQKTETYKAGTKTDSNQKSAAIVPGLIAGLGYEFIPKLVIAGKYMRDLAKGTKDKDPQLRDLRNSGYSLTLGYRF